MVPSRPECYPLLQKGAVDVTLVIREEAIVYFQQGLGAGLMIAPIVYPTPLGILMVSLSEICSPGLPIGSS